MVGTLAALLGVGLVGGAVATNPPPGLKVYVRTADGTAVIGATVTVTGANGVQEILTELGGADPTVWYHLYYGVSSAGRYSVQVEHPSYAPSVVDDIRIVEGDFYGGSIIPVDILIKVNPQSAGADLGAKAVDK